MLKTKQSEIETKTLLTKYDEEIQLKLLFNDEGDNYFELTLSEESKIRKELLEDVETGDLPNNLL
jgi:hypothetical protein